MPSEEWDVITKLFQNINTSAADVWEWISKFILHFTERVITYPCHNYNQPMLLKGALGIWASMTWKPNETVSIFPGTYSTRLAKGDLFDLSNLK